VEDAVILPFILLVIASAATANVSGKGKFLSHPWTVRLGEWSFALYLTHCLLLEQVVHLDPGSKARSAPLQLLEGGAFVLAAVAVSAPAFSWFEKPIEKRLRGRRPAPRWLKRKKGGRRQVGVHGAVRCRSCLKREREAVRSVTTARCRSRWIFRCPGSLAGRFRYVLRG
jgi:peptidoglycan/LPS O-acetylase OafA/YrhL